MSNSSIFYQWNNEPDGVGIKLSDNYLNYLINKSVIKAGSFTELSRQTGISKASLFNYNNCIGLNIGNLKKILNFLGINYNRINHRIKRIGWNQYHLDIDFNSLEMATILAASLADGHINKSHFMYKNKNPELINKVALAIKSIFGEDISILFCIDKNGTPYILSPSFVKRQLEFLGSPIGKKLFVNPKVPKIIINGNLLQKKYFIQQFFDDEGWPQIENRFVACSQNSDTTSIIPKEYFNLLLLGKKVSVGKIPLELRLKIIKPNLLLDIKEILEKDFGMKPLLRLKGIAKYLKGEIFYISANWQLELSKKNDIKKFNDEISFFSSNKRKILETILLNPIAPKDFVYKTINFAIDYKMKGLKFKVKDLQKEININRGKIRKRLQVMVKDKILTNESGKYSFNFEV